MTKFYVLLFVLMVFITKAISQTVYKRWITEESPQYCFEFQEIGYSIVAGSENVKVIVRNDHLILKDCFRPGFLSGYTKYKFKIVKLTENELWLYQDPENFIHDAFPPGLTKLVAKDCIQIF